MKKASEEEQRPADGTEVFSRETLVEKMITQLPGLKSRRPDDVTV